MSRKSQDSFEFGPFRLVPAQRLLLRGGQAVALTPKAFEVLLVLVERKGELVEKGELMRALWPDSFVEEANLNNNVYLLRKALGNDQNYIETVPKHGYRFAAEVRARPGADGEVLVVEKRTVTHTITEEEAQVGDDPATATGRPTLGPVVAGSASRRRVGPAAPLALALLCLSVVAALALLVRPSATSGTGRGTEAAPLRKIAVLPFKTLGGEGGDDEYLGLGMTDALITRLGYSRRLVVRPTSAVRRYTDPRHDPVAAGRQQGVEAVLDGSIQRSGDRVRVTVQLVEVATGATIWSGKFDEPFTDIFGVQDAISQRVMRDLLVELDAEEQTRLGRHGARSAAAYESYQRGRYFWNKRTRDGYRKAVEHFNRAIELDPAYARAYAGLADATLFLGGDDAAGQHEALAKGKAALQKAIELDETLAEPHATLGLLAMNNDRDWAGAEREYRRAIELNPNYAAAHHWYGESLAYVGRFDEAVAEVKRAQELDPLSLIIGTDLGNVYYLSRQYDRAVEQLQKTLELDPDYPMAHLWLGLAYSAQGRHEAAIAELLRIRNLEDDQLQLSVAGYIYGMAGRRGEAQQALSRLAVLSRQTYVAPSSMARVYMGLGERDEALRWVERMFDERDVGVVALKVSPIFDVLRPDPRYPDLLRRAGIAH